MSSEYKKNRSKLAASAASVKHHSDSDESGDSDSEPELEIKINKNHRNSAAAAATKELIIGDKLDVPVATREYTTDHKEPDTILIALCQSLSAIRQQNIPPGTGPSISSHSPVPLFYTVDTIEKPAEILKLNEKSGIKKGITGKEIQCDWKTCLENPEHRFIARFPVTPQIQSDRHQFRLTFQLASGDYVDLLKEIQTLITQATTANEKTLTLNLTLTDEQKQQLLHNLKGTIKEGDKDYHIRIHGISVVDRVNHLPISWLGTLLTYEPVLKKPNSWCNTKGISNVHYHGTGSSSSSNSKPGYCIPPCNEIHDTMETFYTLPKYHTHPNVSRWCNVRYKSLVHRLEKCELGINMKAQIKGEDWIAQYTVYEIEMPLVTSTESDDVIQWMIWDRYPDLLLRTKAVPDITEKEVIEFSKIRINDNAPPSIRFLKVVFDSVLNEYKPFMKQNRFLMRLSDEVTFKLQSERSVDTIKQDLSRFVSNPTSPRMNASLFGTFSISLLVEYEQYVGQNNSLVKRSSSNGTSSTVEAKMNTNSLTSDININNNRNKSSRMDYIRQATEESNRIKREREQEEQEEEEREGNPTTTTTTVKARSSYASRSSYRPLVVHS